MKSNRLFVVSGVLSAALGAGSIFPAIVAWLSRGSLQRLDYAVAAIGLALMLVGACLVGSQFIVQRKGGSSIPAAVRAVMTANILFIAFCALETSDGLLLRGGRTVYWTSFLFLPALAVLYGQALAQRWAWWTARTLTAIAALWFALFIALIPFADLRGPSGPAPWYGRLYMAAVSLVFASIAAYAFRCLGRADARGYFSLVHQACNAEK